VPIYWVSAESDELGLRDGSLADIAPTVLDLLALPVPEQMSGRSLIVRD
jgi:2,3-bisphosphoglycerate-independent phosphoglycerate mutase